MYKNRQEAIIADQNLIIDEETTGKKCIELEQIDYKEIWNKINELAFVIEIDEKFCPKRFVDSNNKICTQLGYSKEEFIQTPPSDILSFDENEINLDLYKKLTCKKDDKVSIILMTKDKRCIYTEAYTYSFVKDKKKYILVIATDVTENKKLEKQIKGILKGIPDVIKVFNADHRVIFFNEAGYNAYNKMPQEVIGKKCHEIMCRKEICIDCYFEKVIRTKQMVSTERYIPELNKFMDVCFNPVLNEDGEILFVVERLKDITEKKMLHRILKNSEERYKQIINSSPDSIVIIVDNKIILANHEACKLIGVDYSNLIGGSIYKYFQTKYKKAVHKRVRNIITHKKVKNTCDYEFTCLDNKITTLQISCSYIVYDSKSAILAVIRDVTDMKRDLNKAAEFQRSTLQRCFPVEKFIDVASVYAPAKTISGDFYHVYKVNDNLIIGIVVDVRGKGISAALNISAFDILFFQEVAVTHEPINIVKNLNKKLVSYYEENYIAVCCFSMDFNKNELNVVGAGINQFLLQKKGQVVEEMIVEGMFLGMFEDAEFCEQTISFQSGDKVFFFTDGLDFILDEDRIVQRYMGKVNIYQLKKYLQEFLDDTILENGTLEDDCTMIAIEIK